MQTILYSYCIDPTTFCIWYLRHNLSVFDTAGLFFLCKFLFTCPFVSDVVQLLSLGFGLCCKVCMATSIDRMVAQWSDGMALRQKERKKGKGDRAVQSGG